ncbi:MAG: cobalamin biosynthesis protein CbiX [Deltaproteobacteria bacterium]|nr:cobalamin biosynthesis protein CbiX [Deltaproteobacteria bacterium]MBW2541725.1 cobalamin biosynthesis protein CbiX [Deltaproteobacteria bacterium]
MKRAILLVDHGSRRAEANELLEEVAAQIRKRAADSIVEVAHLEIAEPGIGEGIETCVRKGATRIVVHPFFLGPGRHTSEDIPAQVERAAREHPNVQIRISEPLGNHAALIDVILDRVSDADR